MCLLRESLCVGADVCERAVESEGFVESNETWAVAWDSIPALSRMMMAEEHNVKAFGNAFLVPMGLAVRTEKYIQKECEMQGKCDGSTVLI